jgi:hypothetical protein
VTTEDGTSVDWLDAEEIHTALLGTIEAKANVCPTGCPAEGTVDRMLFVGDTLLEWAV